MRISVFGLGYVGAVSSACLAEMGHEVVGVDIAREKVDAINRGESPIVEELIHELITEMSASGRLSATTDAEAAIAATDMSLICVGTPSGPAGDPNLDFVAHVSAEIGAALRRKADYHLVIVRSTILPGSMAAVVAPALRESSGKTLGEDYGLCFHPEFLREGSSVRDFRDPPKIVIGASDQRAAQGLAALYENFDAPLFVTSIQTAEMVKYADNVFHALKVAFGNEIGVLCKSAGIDGHDVMRIFTQDTKLNISPTYLMPGFAYGGSCLPKDLRAINHLARSRNLDLPILGSIARSNEKHILRALDLACARGGDEIAVLGLSFKQGTDDLRESPLVELVERLIGKGHRIRIFDENVSLARLRGGNKAYIEEHLPHLSELLSPDLDAMVAAADLVIVGAAHPDFSRVLVAHPDKRVLDLARLWPDPPERDGYEGICW